MGLFGKKEEEAVPTIELTPSQAVVVDPPKPKPAASSGFTVESAIELMRKLPVDQNVQLVIQVVRSTLASMNVRVEDIIEDATKRANGIEEQILKLRAQITDLEKEIASRRQDISKHEADLTETVALKERLQLGESAAAAAAATGTNGAAATGTSGPAPARPAPFKPTGSTTAFPPAPKRS